MKRYLIEARTPASGHSSIIASFHQRKPATDHMQALREADRVRQWGSGERPSYRVIDSKEMVAA